MCVTYATTSMRRGTISERINVSLDLLQVWNKNKNIRQLNTDEVLVICSVTKNSVLHFTDALEVH